MSAARTRAWLTVVPLLLAAVAACSGEPVPAAAPAAPSPSTSPSTSTSPSPSPAPSPLTADPLTGRSQVPTGSVVAIKIDNAPVARPFQRGFGQASVIYQELVEGGATRFLAVYAPPTAAEVGPVRSVRESDVVLLQQYGRVVLGSSGANPGVLATVAKAVSQGRLLEVNEDVLHEPFRKAGRRADAFNFYTSPEKLNRARPGGDGVRDVGLRFGPLPAAAGTPATRASIAFSPRSRVRVTYGAGGRWSVFQDGTRMKDYAPTNIVVQHVTIASSRYADVLGNVTPYTTTLGQGAVEVLRDGRRLSGTWRRLGGDTGTRFLDAKGRDLPLRPGPTLVLLVPAGRPLQVG